MTTASRTAGRRIAFAVTGVLAAVAGMAAGHLVAGIVNPAASPVLAVGSTVIDLTPTPLKEFAIARFGTADKAVLLGPRSASSRWSSRPSRGCCPAVARRSASG